MISAIPSFFIKKIRNIPSSNNIPKSGHKVEYIHHVDDYWYYFKENKHNDPLFSVYEVAFSVVAGLFIKKDLTPPVRLAFANNKSDALSNFERSDISDLKKYIENANNEEIKLNEEFRKKIQAINLDDNNWGNVEFDLHEVEGLRKFLNKRGAAKLIEKLKFPKKEIIGVAILDLNYVLPENRVCGDDLVRDLHNILDLKFDAKQLDKGYVFLGDLPQGYLSKLFNSKKELTKHNITIDLSSKASILGSSYELEEDDLHKNNIGFYIQQEDKGNKKIVFFKIDHDMMFYDSIASALNMRDFHVFLKGKSFAITARDIKNFPNLQDASLHYWPTNWRLFSKGNKAYKNRSDRNVFKDLAKNSDFIKYKWESFLKGLLIAEFGVKNKILEVIGLENIHIANQIDIALRERMSDLKNVLFSMSEFREFLQNNNNEVFNTFTSEISEQLGIDHETVKEKLSLFRGNTYNIVEKDSPLHVAIKLGNFRYDATMEMKACQEAINEPNAEGKTPLALACAAGDLAMIRYLLYKDAEVTTEIIRECTERQQSDVIQILLEHCPERKYFSPVFKTSPEKETYCFQAWRKKLFDSAEKNMSKIEFISSISTPLEAGFMENKILHLKQYANILKDKISISEVTLKQDNPLIISLKGNLDKQEFSVDLTGSDIFEVLNSLYKNKLLENLSLPDSQIFKLQLLQYADDDSVFMRQILRQPKETEETTFVELFKQTINELGARKDLTLKQKKNQAITVLNYISSQIKVPENLRKIKTFLDTDNSAKYLQQLTSQLWLIRKLRGAFGKTTTYITMQDIISERLYGLASESVDASKYNGHRLMNNTQISEPSSNDKTTAIVLSDLPCKTG